MSQSTTDPLQEIARILAEALLRDFEKNFANFENLTGQKSQFERPWSEKKHPTFSKRKVNHEK